MRRILIATIAAVGFASVAAAQQAPVYAGLYGPSVAGNLADTGSIVIPTGDGIDRTFTAALMAGPDEAGENFQAEWNLRSGR